MLLFACRIEFVKWPKASVIFDAYIDLFCG
jgi:hypothetical protein